MIHGFPARKPAALVLVDVAKRGLDTFVENEIAGAVEKLAAYDLIAAIVFARAPRMSMPRGGAVVLE